VNNLSDSSLIENIRTAVLVFDKRLCLTGINAAAENLLSVSGNKIKGLGPDEILPGSGRFSMNLRRTLVEMRPCTEWGIDLYLPDQKRITVGCMVTPVMEADQCEQLIVELVDADSFSRILHEESISAVHDAARKSLRGMAHEIKNPLGGLRGAAQLLEQELDNSDLTEYTRIIISEADRLRNLVDRMLAHDTRLQPANINLHEILEYVIELIEAEAGTQLNINKDYDPSLPLLHADREQLIQVFINIIRNAVQAIPPQGCIRIRTRIRRHCAIRRQFHKMVALIEIMDNGPGVPPEIEREVFYPLVTGRAEGSGLGLSIALSLLRRHGGSISYQRDNDTSVFSILLPLEYPDE